MIVKNTFYNLLGLGLPLVVAIFTIPVLIESLGVARFGVLTLIWAIVSYISLLDMGLGRALTLELSVLVAKRKFWRISKVLGTTYFLMAIIGLVLAGLTAVFSEKLAYLLKGLENYQEVINALYVMAFAIPFVILSAGARGVLEANGRFDLVNFIRVPVGVFTFLGPMFVVLSWGTRLDYIALVLLAVRVMSLSVYYWYASRTIPENFRCLQIDLRYAKPLVSNGGWMTVSNIISPLMGYIDRFLIGAIVSASAVAYYATPHEVVTKLWIIPGALTAVLFPVFASAFLEKTDRSSFLYEKSIEVIFAVMLPLCGFFILFEQEILSFWIGSDFAHESRYIFALLALGILINSLAHVPFTAIQSSGHSKKTALIHLAEFPFFLLLLMWLVNVYGPLGAALAWLLRMSVDTVLMFYFSSVAPAIQNNNLTSISRYIFIVSVMLLLIFLNIGVFWKASVELLIILYAAIKLYFQIKNRLVI